MRFVMLLKSDLAAEAGIMPGDADVAAMTRYNNTLLRSGTLLASYACRETALGARVAFHRGDASARRGPYGVPRELLAGHWLIQARTLDEAVGWAVRAPLEDCRENGCGEIEVRPLFELEDFAHNPEEVDGRSPCPDDEGEPLEAAPLRRYMMLRKAGVETEAGVAPGRELLAVIGRYHSRMLEAGAFVAREVLKPSAEGVRVLFSHGRPEVTPGPFAVGGELLAAYTIIRAGSLEEAISWAVQWPPLDGGGELQLDVRRMFGDDDSPGR